MKKLRVGRPSPAMIVALVALVVAMAGTGYAAVKLPKKSVGTAQLKAKAVTDAKIKNGTITGKKLKLKTIGTVPNAAHASVADTANALPAPTLHVVGAPGEPAFLEGTQNYVIEGVPYAYPPASFYKDHNGVVHLEGVVKTGGGQSIFVLPPGYRPASGMFLPFFGAELDVVVFGSNISSAGKDLSGYVASLKEGAVLTGISFLAQS